jgi:hypothetical protein
VTLRIVWHIFLRGIGISVSTSTAAIHSNERLREIRLTRQIGARDLFRPPRPLVDENLGQGDLPADVTDKWRYIKTVINSLKLPLCSHLHRFNLQNAEQLREALQQSQDRPSQFS